MAERSLSTSGAVASGRSITVEIPLSRGLVAVVDADVADRILAMGSWYAETVRRTTYATRNVRRDDGKRGPVRMHQAITGWPRTDHVNGNGLDNRRANLRSATAAQNGRNMRRRRDNTSGFKGVSWNAKSARWAAHICVEGRNVWLGGFVDPIEAARAYDAAAVRHFGEFALTNFSARRPVAPA